MLIKFFKRPTKINSGGKGGSPRASMNYLLSKKEDEFRILQGNPELSIGLTFLSSVNFSEPTQLYGNNIEFIPVLLGCAGVIIGGAIIFITVRLMK